MIVRPKDKLREEIKAAKKRRKEEKKLLREEKSLCKDVSDPRKLKAKLERLQAKRDRSGKEELVLPPVTFDAPKPAASSHPHTQKKLV